MAQVTTVESGEYPDRCDCGQATHFALTFSKLANPPKRVGIRAGACTSCMYRRELGKLVKYPLPTFHNLLIESFAAAPLEVVRPVEPLKPELGVVFTTEHEADRRYSSYEYFTFRAQVVSMGKRDNYDTPADAAAIRYIDQSRGYFLKDLTLTAQAERGQECFHEPNLKYRHTHSVDLRDATRMARTLQRIERRTKKFHESGGGQEPETFSDFLFVFTEVIGATFMAEHRGHGFEPLTVTEGLARVTFLEQEWFDQHKAHRAELAAERERQRESQRNP